MPTGVATSRLPMLNSVQVSSPWANVSAAVDEPPIWMFSPRIGSMSIGWTKTETVPEAVAPVASVTVSSKVSSTSAATLSVLTSTVVEVVPLSARVALGPETCVHP